MKRCLSDSVSLIGDAQQSGIAKETCHRLNMTLCTSLSHVPARSQLGKASRTDGNVGPGVIVTITKKSQASRLWPGWPVALCS